MPKIDLNKKFKYALELMEKTNKNLFITGRAGTGKSTLLEYFRSQTNKNIVVLAPTGVAAVNVKGQTIHSFFHFKPDITLSKVRKIRVSDEDRNMYQKLEVIIIDEISMVRADLLDCVDKFLRFYGPTGKLPFGGVQMIFIGDLYQLPPIVTSGEREIFSTHYESPYFFSAHVINEAKKKLIVDENDFKMEIIELEKIYRQRDEDFIFLLNNIRNATITEKDLQKINQRHQPDFKPQPTDFFIHLTTTNDMAATVNEASLNRLNGEIYEYPGDISGHFEEKNLPTDKKLRFKIGAQVMMLNNDSGGKWINGTVGKVLGVKKDFTAGADVVMVELADGEIVDVAPHRWDIYKFYFDTRSKSVESETVGSFTQYPFKLAWAVTIHKAQGKTFKKAVIDIGRGTFSSGQLYVALSRCVSLDGMILKTPIRREHIWLDKRVREWVEGVAKR